MSNIKKNIIWAAVFLIVILISSVTLMVRRNSTSGAVSAKIIQNSSVVRTIDLSKVDEPYEFTVTNADGGENTIRVEKGRIAVIKASCPDKICVHRGYAEDGSFPIVCLPNKLSIVVTGEEGDIDAIAGGDAQ